MPQKPEINAGLMDHFARMQALPFTYFSLIEVCLSKKFSVMSDLIENSA